MKKMNTQQMTKAVMARYTQYINKYTTDGDIFDMVRKIEIESTSDTFKVDNWDEFYWFLRDCRDELKNG